MPTIDLSKYQPLYTPLAIFAGCLVIAAAIYGSGGVTIGGGREATDLPSVAGEEGTKPSAGAEGVNISADDDPYLGKEDAPVTIIEFSDLECPFCERFHTQTFPQIKSQYIDTGKVKFVYRDFPLPMHTNAQKAAEASECADEQGKFWEYIDLIFANQASLSLASLKSWAGSLGLNTSDFNKCLDSGRYADEVKKDLADGQAAGVQGTPAFFVNGQLVSGAQPFESFQSLIEAALAR